MNFLTEKLRNAEDKLKSTGFYDKRFLSLVILAVVGLSVVWNGVRVVQQNYGLLQKIAVIEEENRILELENRNKQIQNEYYKTAEFAELKTRRVNGKAAAGETVYIVTEETALAALKTDEAEETQADPIKEKPRYQQNFEAWIDFFFGDKD